MAVKVARSLMPAKDIKGMQVSVIIHDKPSAVSMTNGLCCLDTQSNAAGVSIVPRGDGSANSPENHPEHQNEHYSKHHPEHHASTIKTNIKATIKTTIQSTILNITHKIIQNTTQSTIQDTIQGTQTILTNRTYRTVPTRILRRS